MRSRLGFRRGRWAFVWLRRPALISRADHAGANADELPHRLSL
jgi:hypothetical protein